MGFSHVRKTLPSMVDIGGKTPTQRTARAEARVLLPKEIRKRFDGNDIRGPKGAVFQTAIIAGVMAAKRTAEIIPLCHSLPLDDCRIILTMEKAGVRIECLAKTRYGTGVEMEALTGAAAAALTIYDMCKGLSHDITISEIRLLEKSGGKHDFRR